MDKGDTKKHADRSLVITDPMGSYTGVPWDKDDKPVQDADDL